MKKNKVLIFLIVVLLLSFTLCFLSACKDGHKHKYSWYISKQATCIEDGYLEGICECGHKEYETLKADHILDKDNVCMVCGDGKATVEDGQILGYNIETLYNLMVDYGYTVDFWSFKNCIDDYTISEIKIDNLNIIHILLNAYGEEFSLFTSCKKGQFNIVKPNDLQFVRDIKITSNKFICVLADGTEQDFGKIENLTSINNGEKAVRSVFINQDNWLLLIFSDNTVKVVGEIATTDTKIDGADFIYRKINEKNEYAVVALSKNCASEIEIPATHKGLPITQIDNSAFYNNQQITKVVLGENITNLGASAFASCKNLQNITFNNKLKAIGMWCFFECEKLARVIMPESVETIQTKAFEKTNCTIYSYLESKPNGWLYYWGKNTVYWLGTWELVNGVPMPLQ